MTITASDQAHLRRAVSLLAGVGWADPAGVDPGAALFCLAAAEQLRPLSGPVLPATGTAPAIAVDRALASFVALTEETFAEEAVLDAADYARRARALLT